MRPQFAKAYYNLGMIHDRLGDIAQASSFYKRAIDKCEQLDTTPPFYSKVVTNYAVILEKLGKREEALSLLDGHSQEGGQEVRIYNNKGIIYKRKGDLQEALASYNAALEIDENSFFPNYNLGVLKAQMKDYHSALIHLNKALELAKSTKESVYQINVQVNIALLLERTGDIAGAVAGL
jgi:tetratricopeptide (TPR) repeat protein